MDKDFIKQAEITHRARVYAEIERMEKFEVEGWRNLYFMKDGTTFLAPKIYSSKPKAAEAAKNFIRGEDGYTKVKEILSGKVFLIEDLSHAIQMPVGKGS